MLQNAKYDTQHAFYLKSVAVNSKFPRKLLLRQYCSMSEIAGCNKNNCNMAFGSLNVHVVISRDIQKTSEGSKSSTHYLCDKNRFDVSSKGPSSGISVNYHTNSRRRAFARNVESVFIA